MGDKNWKCPGLDIYSDGGAEIAGYGCPPLHYTTPEKTPWIEEETFANII